MRISHLYIAILLGSLLAGLQACAGLGDSCGMDSKVKAVLRMGLIDCDEVCAQADNEGITIEFAEALLAFDCELIPRSVTLDGSECDLCREAQACVDAEPHGSAPEITSVTSELVEVVEGEHAEYLLTTTFTDPDGDALDYNYTISGDGPWTEPGVSWEFCGQTEVVFVEDHWVEPETEAHEIEIWITDEYGNESDHEIVETPPH